MPALDVRGTQLEYVEQGRGHPVVLVHGTLGDYRSWGLQMDALARKYRTIAYSRRYHHPNACSGEETDYSPALHAHDLDAMLTGLGLESAHIVGSSYGAHVALFLAVRHPRRVRSLVLGEPPVAPILEHLPEARALLDGFLATAWRPAGASLRRGDMEAGVQLFVDGIFGDGAFDRFPAEVRALLMDNARALKVETASPHYFMPFSCADAGRIEAPTLLLAGDSTLRMFEMVVAELERCMPNVAFAQVPCSTHRLPADNPGAYNAIVMDFLARHAE